MMNSSRDESIDILKFIAVLLIINSPLDSCYVKYAFLATGGSIGDALFLFCSGYTLFWKDNKSFASFFKRRINRIYPSVFACLFFAERVKQKNYKQRANGACPQLHAVAFGAAFC